MRVHVTFHRASHFFELAESDDVSALKELISTALALPTANQKLLYRGKQLLERDGCPRDGKVMLLASTRESIDAVKSESQRHSALRPTQSDGHHGRGRAKVTVNKTRSVRDLENAARYTFARISPLVHLPDSERSLSFLRRLAEDAAIGKLMARHALSVGHLTELDPRLTTSHDSKLLGLNKNAGQEILLRLRTDGVDGWRDYKTVRATLVHELVHNTVNDHPREFWELFNAYSRQVVEFESGRVMGAREDVYIPPDAKLCDHSMWQGGTHLLSVGGKQSELPRDGSSQASDNLDEREVRARAAEQRMGEKK